MLQVSRNHGRTLKLALATAFVSSATAFAAQAAERVVVVLDSSGSMAGKINGQRKIDIAKDAVESLLRTIPRSAEIGLMAYGHRRKDDCSDIQMISPVGPPDHAAILGAVDELRPVGKTPLGQSVLRAAKKLNFTEERATVILVSDGKENCGIDPCALGNQLKRQGIDFKAHVIGFNLRKGQDEGLRCLARNTGGLYVEAKDAPALKKALTETVKKAAAPVVITPKPQKPEQPKMAPGLKLRVLTKAGGAEFKGQINATIYGPPQGLDGKRKKIANIYRKHSGYIFKGLKPGEYLLHVEPSDARYISRKFKLVVGENPAQIENVVMNMGQVRFDYALSEGGRPFNWQVNWNLYEPKADFHGKRKRIVNLYRKHSGNVFWLPAGKWLLQGEISDARYLKVSQTIEVEPGSAELHTFNFNGGLVRFDAKLSEEGQNYKGQINWDIWGKPKGLEGKRPKIANFYRKRSGTIFVLPAGEWTLTGALSDHRQVGLRTKIKVVPGSEELHVFNFKAGTIRFDVTVAGQPTKAQANIDIYEEKQDLSGKRKRIVNLYRKHSGVITILPAGRYLLGAVLSDQRTTKAEGVLTVEAGDEKPVVIDLAK